MVRLVITGTLREMREEKLYIYFSGAAKNNEMMVYMDLKKRTSRKIHVCPVRIKEEIVTMVDLKFRSLFNKERLKDWSRA